MKYQSVNFHKRPNPHPSRFKVASERTGRSSRRSQQGDYPKSYLGCKNGSSSTADGQARAKVSRRKKSPRCASCYLGRFGCGNWAGSRTCAPRRSRNRERMGGQVRQTGRSKTVCRSCPERCRAGRSKHTRTLGPNHQAFPNFDSGASRPAVPKVLSEQCHRPTFQTGEGSAPAQSNRGKFPGALALDGPNNAFRPGRQGKGAFPCRDR